MSDLTAALRAYANENRAPISELVEAVEESLTDAWRKNPRAQEGDKITLDLESGAVELEASGTVQPNPLGGAIVVQALRQGMTTWSKDRARRAVVGEWADREGRAFDATVTSIAKNGDVFMTINGTSAVLKSGEQFDEDLKTGETKAVLVLAANAVGTATRLTVSRRQPLLLEQLLKRHCPEVQNGKIAVRSTVRNPGEIALVTVEYTNKAGENYKNLKASDVVTGVGGHRIQNVMEALSWEDVKVVDHSDTAEDVIIETLGSDRVVSVAKDPANGRLVTVRQAPGRRIPPVLISLAQRATRTKIKVVAAR